MNSWFLLMTVGAILNTLSSQTYAPNVLLSLTQLSCKSSWNNNFYFSLDDPWNVQFVMSGVGLLDKPGTKSIRSACSCHSPMFKANYTLLCLVAESNHCYYVARLPVLYPSNDNRAYSLIDFPFYDYQHVSWLWHLKHRNLVNNPIFRTLKLIELSFISLWIWWLCLLSFVILNSVGLKNGFKWYYLYNIYCNNVS